MLRVALMGRGLPFDAGTKERKNVMEYSVTVWRTPVREWKEVLYRLTYRREWIPELNCWRDVLVKDQRI
jgi:hypothetical protein